MLPPSASWFLAVGLAGELPICCKGAFFPSAGLQFLPLVVLLLLVVAFARRIVLKVLVLAVVLVVVLVGFLVVLFLLVLVLVLVLLFSVFVLGFFVLGDLPFDPDQV